MDCAPADARAPGAAPAALRFLSKVLVGRSPQVHGAGQGRARQPEPRRQVRGGPRAPSSPRARPGPAPRPARASAPRAPLGRRLRLGSCGRAAAALVPPERSSVIYITPPSCLPPGPRAPGRAGARARTQGRARTHLHTRICTHICTHSHTATHGLTHTRTAAQPARRTRAHTSRRPRAAPRAQGDAAREAPRHRTLEATRALDGGILNRPPPHPAAGLSPRPATEPIEALRAPCRGPRARGEAALPSPGGHRVPHPAARRWGAGYRGSAGLGPGWPSLGSRRCQS